MKPRSLKTCIFRGVLLAALAVTTRVFGQEKLTLEPVVSPPLFGTFYSMQRPDYPPLPLHPFPELPLFETGIKHVYWFDDRAVDYAALRKLQAQEAAANTPPAGLAPLGGEEGGEEGGGGGMMLMSGGAGLKLTIPVFTNGFVYTTIFEHNPAWPYDLYYRTTFGPFTWTVAASAPAGQTNFWLPDVFGPELWLAAGSAADADGDGLKDGAEQLVWGTDEGHADTDGDGTLDGPEIWQGRDPWVGWVSDVTGAVGLETTVWRR
jgi:hypothetical protein